jgi:hypothetical protein
MTTTFIYKVNGIEIEDTEAFGKGWEKAKELATENHCGITRTVIKTEEQFFATGGVFLDNKFYHSDKMKIF